MYLSHSRLGPSEADFWRFSRHVEDIPHSKCTHSGIIRTYCASATPSSTKQIVRLAAPRRTPIHYISLAGVISASVLTGTAASAAAYAPLVDGSNGIFVSRWASDQSIEKATATLGTSVSMHRFTPAEKVFETTTSLLDEFVRFTDYHV